MQNISKKLKLILLILAIGFVFLSGVVTQSVVTKQKLLTPTNSPSSKAEYSALPSADGELKQGTDVLGEHDEDLTSSASSGIKTPVASSSASSSNRQKVKVVRVVDGDTIEIEGGKTVRYIGMDTPETVKPNTPVQCFGKEASAKNKELVEGKEVELEKDVSETDRYGRLLRYVYVGETMVNKYLVDLGYAYSSTYPPDVKYQEVFREAQKLAQENKKGLWSSCDVDPKKVISAVTPQPVVQGAATVVNVANTPNSTEYKSVPAPSTATTGNRSADKTGCVIKGNISSSGKIYHLPGCASYEKTTINESQGERWFCSESEAEQAGWRKAKNC